MTSPELGYPHKNLSADQCEQLRAVRALIDVQVASASSNAPERNDIASSSPADAAAPSEVHEGPRSRGNSIGEDVAARLHPTSAELRAHRSSKESTENAIDEHTPPPSVGSTGHPSDCKPCMYYFSKGGCIRNAECLFCHFSHKSSHQEKRSAWKELMRERKARIRRMKSKPETTSDAAEPITIPLDGMQEEGREEAPLSSTGASSGPASSPSGSAPSGGGRAVKTPSAGSMSSGGLAGTGPPASSMPSGGRSSSKTSAGPGVPGSPVTRPVPGGHVPQIGGAHSSVSPKAGSVSKVAVGSFAESLSVLSIQGNPVSVAIANPYLVDCPLIGISDGFQTLTGYPREEILGRNCRFLNQECGVNKSVLFKLRHAIVTGSEVFVSLTNRRKAGTFFANLLQLSTVRVGDRIYIIGIQVDDTIEAGGKISTTPDHQIELQAVLDRIFDHHVDKWAEKQLQEFCVNLPQSYSAVLQKFDLEWYTATKRAFVFREDGLSRDDFEISCKNNFLEVDGPDDRIRPQRSASDPDLAIAQERPGRGTGKASASDFFGDPAQDPAKPSPEPGQAKESSPGVVGGGETVGSSSGSRDPPSVRYTPSAMILAVGQSLNWGPDLTDLVGKCVYTVCPPLMPGLSIDRDTGTISGAVGEVAPGYENWMDYTVSVTNGTAKCSVTLQIKVVDFQNASCRLQILSELPGNQYVVICKRKKAQGVPTSNEVAATPSWYGEQTRSL